jgi:hypothetical protein
LWIIITFRIYYSCLFSINAKSKDKIKRKYQLRSTTFIQKCFNIDWIMSGFCNMLFFCKYIWVYSVIRLFETKHRIYRSILPQTLLAQKRYEILYTLPLWKYCLFGTAERLLLRYKRVSRATIYQSGHICKTSSGRLWNLISTKLLLIYDELYEITTATIILEHNFCL